MSDGGQTELHARHLLLCQQVLYDPFAAGTAFSPRGLLVSLQPGDDIGDPLAAEEIAVFAQVFGDPGDYRLGPDLLVPPEQATASREVLPAVAEMLAAGRAADAEAVFARLRAAGLALRAVVGDDGVLRVTTVGA